MRILVIGLGSIGQRHLNNLIGLGYNDLSVVTSKPSFEVNGLSIPSFTSVEQALDNQAFDAAVLCSPTAFHMPAILELLQAKIKRIYIEKPVSHNLEQVDEVLKLANAYTAKIIVGYDLHFDPGMMKVHELIQSNAVGKIVSVNAVVGQYLPTWRPHEDYRKGMSAKVETGGGVMLDLVHEFDYLYWLFGKVKSIGCFFTNSGSLEIETEDVAEVILKFESGVLGTIHLDYLQQQLVRNCMITGSTGTIFWNLAVRKVNWIENGSTKEFCYEHADRNDRFVSIMKSFMSDESDPRLTSLQDGIESLRMVVAAKQASIKNEILTLQ
jgi:predicted dehydrogenase